MLYITWYVFIYILICHICKPGVGKTSLGKSIAESMSREFHRISLGGVRDEADMRFVKNNYIGLYISINTGKHIEVIDVPT